MQTRERGPPSARAEISFVTGEQVFGASHVSEPDDNLKALQKYHEKKTETIYDFLKASL